MLDVVARDSMFLCAGYNGGQSVDIWPLSVRTMRRMNKKPSCRQDRRPYWHTTDYL